MIKNARALETTYVPQDLQHRDGHIQQLAAALRPISSGLSGEHSMIFGPSGSGKTTLAKYVVKMLRKEAFDVRTAYWNCMGGSSKTDVLHGLVNDAELGRHLPADGVPSSRYINQIRDTDDHVVTIVDEVDELEDEATLLSLTDEPNVTLVVITTDEDYLFADPKFSGRIKSRFSGGEKLHLSLFSDDELEDILYYRINHGLRPGVIEPEVVGEIATMAEGNARNAINLLRRATKSCLNDSRSMITIADVQGAEDGAAEDARQEHIEALGTHKRLLYDIIESAGEIPATELAECYKQRCANPKGRSTRHRYLTSLEEKYGLIKSSGSTKGKRYSITSS